MKMLVIVYIINIILTLGFILYNKEEKQSKLFAFMFLVVPIMGLAIYLIPHYIYLYSHKKDLYERKELHSIKQEESFQTRPKVNEELGIVPFGEALVVSGIGEKRKFLLDILKENMQDNYKVIMSALEDSDSETSHYAAAATMEVSRKMRNSLQDIETKFLNNRENHEYRRKFIDELYEYIESGVLSSRDRIININKYIKLLQDTIENYKELTKQSDYIHLIGFYMDQNQLYEAAEIAKKRKVECEDEAIYMQLLEIYYRIKNLREFRIILQELRESKVALSRKGIETVRFWIARGC